MRALVEPAFGALPALGEPANEQPPAVVRHAQVRAKDLEQSHVLLGTSSYPQDHDDRYAAYVLNTMLGGSMSSRLFQNVREKRGLAYAVFSNLVAYRDAGQLTVYAGCANSAVAELVKVVVDELRGMKQPPPDTELRRAKDHLKGSLMLSLEAPRAACRTWPARRCISTASSASTRPSKASNASRPTTSSAWRGICSPTARSARRCLGSRAG